MSNLALSNMIEAGFTPVFGVASVYLMQLTSREAASIPVDCPVQVRAIGHDMADIYTTEADMDAALECLDKVGLL